jgi:hypothetical protein
MEEGWLDNELHLRQEQYINAAGFLNTYYMFLTTKLAGAKKFE